MAVRQSRISDDERFRLYRCPKCNAERTTRESDFDAEKTKKIIYRVINEEKDRAYARQFNAAL